ncbi:phage holin family protein [Mycobacterium cookii]|uniref:Phage holin family protein n=1 Tax=Nocardioides furvisabuli TaxID=375542 RepID=A0ABN2X1P0_9ACTN|nr:phage holin family protein [Nocardioides furvisabuli]
MRFITWLLTYAAGLSVAAWLLDGISFTGARSGQAELQDKVVPVLLVALILGLVSTFIEPVVKLLSLPFIILTLGFLLLVINALMLMLTARLADAFDIGFTVDGFWTAVVGSLVITVVGWGVRTALPSRD